MTKILTTTLVGLLITSLILSSTGWAFSNPTVLDTTTPIKHVVIVFQENISYDHYYGVYPNAPGFTTKPGTPTSDNYVSHPDLITHNPNLYHLPPVSLSEIGHNGQANHQYDLGYFWAALSSGNLPSVSYVKAYKAGDGHAGT